METNAKVINGSIVLPPEANMTGASEKQGRRKTSYEPLIWAGKPGLTREQHDRSKKHWPYLPSRAREALREYWDAQEEYEAARAAGDRQMKLKWMARAQSLRRELARDNAENTPSKEADKPAIG